MSETPESDEEIWQSIRHTSMDELAQEIGRMCLYWSELEMAVSVLLANLLNISDRISGNVIMGALDFRAKLQTTLPLAFDRKITDQWYKDVETVINHIDNDLRPERNRIIHDTWLSLPGRPDPIRMRIQGKVVRTQSRTQEIRLSDVRPFNARDVGLLYVKMIRARDIVGHLSFEYARDRAWPDKLPPQGPPPYQDQG